MTFFKNWTKKQVALGIGLVVMVLLTLLAYTFVTDYEDAKVNTYNQAHQQLADLNVEYYTTVLGTQNRLDEQLLQASTDDALSQDAEFRQAYMTLQNAFLALITNTDTDQFTTDVLDTMNQAQIGNDAMVSVYVNGTDVSSGTAYVLGNVTEVFTFTYTDGVIDSLTHVNTLDMQQVQIEKE